MSKKVITINIEPTALLKCVPQLREFPQKQWQKQISQLANKILESDFGLEIDPNAPLPRPGARLKVGISAKAASAFDEIVEKYALTQADTLLNLLCRYGKDAENKGESLLKNPIGKSFVSHLKDKGFDFRPAQVEAYLGMVQPMMSGKIGLVEAGTGTGKTLSMLMAAKKWAEKHKQRCLITVPTLAIMKQMKREAEKLDIEVSTIAGRQSFASEANLLEVHKSADKNLKAQIEWWIAHRADEQSWSLDDLIEYVEINNPEAVMLGHIANADDKGFLAWNAQFERENVHDSEVVICTHAMLAYDFIARKRRAAEEDDSINNLLELAYDKEVDGFFEHINAAGKKVAIITAESGKLPAYGALIVDEAHLLEKGFANAASSSISLMRLKWNLGALKGKLKSIKPSHEKAVDALIEALRSIPYSNQNSTFALYDDHEWKSAAQKVAKIQIEADKDSLKELDPQDLIRVSEVRDALDKIKAVIGSNLRWVSFSQKKRYPSLHTGSPNVSTYLMLLWGSVHSAALVSATLFVPTKLRGFSSDHIVKTLSLEKNRVQETRVLPPSWLKKPIKHVSCDSAITPASSDDLGAFEEWVETLTVKLKEIIKQAEGGVLILSNANDVAYELTNRIEKINVSPLLYPTLGRQKEHALKLAKAGEKIVWISVGGAWTGLDFSGAELNIPAEQDNLITDLVVLRAPFGQNHSITHLWRKLKFPQYPWEMYEGYFTFKQGLGRLVRREGLPENRQIWVLDGRICNPEGNVFFEMLKREIDRFIPREYS